MITMRKEVVIKIVVALKIVDGSRKSSLSKVYKSFAAVVCLGTEQTLVSNTWMQAGQIHAYRN